MRPENGLILLARLGWLATEGAAHVHDYCEALRRTPGIVPESVEWDKERGIVTCRVCPIPQASITIAVKI